MTLSVSDLAGKTWQVTGRAHMIINLIILHRERINAMVAGSVEFHLAPDGRVQMTLKETMEAMRA